MFGLAKKLVSTLNGVAESNDSRMGLRILNKKEKCPLDVEAFFDYIIGCNGVDITNYLEINTQTGTVSMQNWINFMDHEVNVSNNDITLLIYSAKGNVEREIVVKSTQFHQNGGLAVSVQLTPLNSSQYVWHVLTVQPNSPAYSAGIMPDEYILQCEDGLLATGGEELLSRVIQSQYVKNNNKPLELILYIYNYEADCVRPVRVMIREDWGGRGLLGCDIGYGLLHRIPEKYRINNHLQDDDHAGEEYVSSIKPLEQPPQYLKVASSVHAPYFNENESTDSLKALTEVVQSSTRTKKAKSHMSNNALITDYMKEQSEISRSIDGSNTKSKSTDNHIPLPPPSLKKN